MIIGVITPYGMDFKIWVYTVGKLFYPEADFKQISSVDDVRGYEFDEVVTGYKFWEVDDATFNVAIKRSKSYREFEIRRREDPEDRKKRLNYLLQDYTGIKIKNPEPPEGWGWCNVIMT